MPRAGRVVAAGVPHTLLSGATTANERFISNRQSRFVQGNERGAGLIVEAINGTASVAMEVLAVAAKRNQVSRYSPPIERTQAVTIIAEPRA